ncbi:MAG: SsrA-binding protein SmpB [Firmicutes bacterium]|nr:SsrA-binding protein SmpB [Bacillota bacterium]
MEIKNKKAYFDYFVEDEIEGGIVLTGTEIKSVRKGSVNIKDSYIRIKNNEIFIINMYIAKYERGTYFNHDEYRERKLLLHKKEIKKLHDQISQDSFTLIPLKIYLKNNKAKISIGICKGKKTFDKRQEIKKRDMLKSSYQHIS